MFPKTYSLVPGFLAVALAFAAVPTPAFAQSAPTASAQAAAPKQIVLRLKDNTLLMGHIVREDADVIVFSAGALGELTIKKADVEGQLEPATVAAAFQAPAPPAPPPSNLGVFAPAGKVVYTRVLGAQGSYVTSPYVLGELDPRYPGLTGAALRLPGVVYSVQSQLSLYRTSDRDIVSFDASMNYAYADNAGEQADSPRVSLGYNRRIGTNDKLYGIARHTWSRDGVRKVDFTNQTILGIGIKTINTPKVKLDLVPALSMQYDKKGTSFDEELLFGGGAMEVFQVMLTPVSMIEQKITAYRAFNESRYYGIESSVGFKGMVTKKIGFSITWAHNLDNSIGLRESPIPANTLFPGQAQFNVFANKRSQSTFSSGLLITF